MSSFHTDLDRKAHKQVIYGLLGKFWLKSAFLEAREETKGG